VDPAHTVAGPVIGGNEFTVTAVVVVHPLTEYEIFAVPADTPPTTAITETVAIDVLSLLHTPPGVVLLRLVVDPTQTDVVPVMDGNDPTVIVNVSTQDPSV